MSTLGEEVSGGLAKRLRLQPGLNRRLTTVDQVRSILRLGILRGDLPGGSRLEQSEIADHLGVGTTPVHEAMLDLAGEGLITMDNHRVGVVSTPDWDEMGEISEIRLALVRPAVARSMAGIGEQELKDAWALADQLAEEADVGPWVQMNIRFHSIFHVATRTARLGAILIALEEASGMFVAQAQRLDPEIRRRAVAEHYAILTAYEARDVESAVEAHVSHLALPLEAYRRGDPA